MLIVDMQVHNYSDSYSGHCLSQSGPNFLALICRWLFIQFNVYKCLTKQFKVGPYYKGGLSLQVAAKTSSTVI